MNLFSNRRGILIILILVVVLFPLGWKLVNQRHDIPSAAGLQAEEIESRSFTVPEIHEPAASQASEPAQPVPESVSEEEKAIIAVRINTIADNYQFLEKFRTKAVDHRTEENSSFLAVLIRPGSENEMTEALKFAHQYYDGLGAAAKKEMGSQIRQLHESYDLKNESRYVSMYIAPPDAAGISRVKTEICAVSDADQFLANLERGEFETGPARIEINGGQDDNWRYAHLFKVRETDDM